MTLTFIGISSRKLIWGYSHRVEISLKKSSCKFLMRSLQPGLEATCYVGFYFTFENVFLFKHTTLI